MTDKNGVELKRGQAVKVGARVFEVDDVDNGAAINMVALKKPKEWGGDPDALACDADDVEQLTDEELDAILHAGDEKPQQ